MMCICSDDDSESLLKPAHVPPPRTINDPEDKKIPQKRDRLSKALTAWWKLGMSCWRFILCDATYSCLQSSPYLQT